MAMADWQQYTQSVIFGLVFSFLLAKLFSVIFAFRDENLRITHDNPSEDVTSSEPHWKSAEEDKTSDAEFPKNRISSSRGKEPVVDPQKKVAATSSDSDIDDDWEGVECTELDEAFSAASAFVAATAADRSSQKPSNDLQLKLYGLYKVATEGPCSVPQPSAIKMTARLKWNAWHKMGSMPQEEAMQKYIEIITELYPTWADGLKSKKQTGNSSKQPSSNDNDTRPMGPVFSTFIHEESGNELKLDAIHDFAREGDIKNLVKCIESGVSVDTKDSEGRTPLHWAVDRGHIDVAQVLLSKNADVNLKDNEGQTALHYAAVCEREEIAELLVKGNAETGIKDNDGKYPCDLSDSNWPWIQPQLA